MPRWSGKHAKVYISNYLGGDLENWALECRARLADVTAIDDNYTQRIGLDQDWRLRAEKFVTSPDFVALAANMPGQPFVVQCLNPSGQVIFSAPMFVESARYTNPDGAIREDISLLLAGNPTLVPA